MNLGKGAGSHSIVIDGDAFEFNRFAAGHCENRCIRLFIQPGLWLQRLTTEEPALDQIEVAIRSLKAVIPDYFEKHPEEEPIIDYREKVSDASGTEAESV